MMRMRRFAPWMIAAAGVLWGLLGIFVRHLNTRGLASMDLVFLRSLTATVVLFIGLLIFDRKKMKIRLRDFWCFLGTGIGSIVFFNYCYFTAVRMMSLAAAAVLLYTAPAFVMLMSAVLFREKMTGRRVLSVLLTFAGCACVTGLAGSGISAGGILVGLGAGFGYALYTIFGHYAIERGYDSLTITFYTFLVAAVTSLFMVRLPHVAGALSGSAAALGYVLCLGIVSTILPFLLYTLGLHFVQGGQASVIASIEPVTASIVGIILYHEALTAQTVVGIALVLAGIAVGAERAEKKRRLSPG
jgi:DME family drug/metabolite transporter